MDWIETERKFLLPSVPDAALAVEPLRIEQGYTSSPNGVRLRRQDGVSYMTVKSGAGLNRPEWEVDIPGWVFDNLWPETAGMRISKLRHVVQVGHIVYEIDRYVGRLSGLVVAEMSGPGIVDAAIPEWLGAVAEVTGYDRYSNKGLAVSGRIPDRRG